MKKNKTMMIAVLSVTLMIIVLATGCGKTVKKREHILVVTTIYPYELIVRQITEDNAEVISIVPPSASPHTYSPKPEDIKLLEDADLLISNGANLETFMDKAFTGLKDKHISGYEMLEKVLTDENTEQKGFVEESHHINPHFWLDPLYVSKIGAEILEKLIRIDPANIDQYKANFIKFNEEIGILNEKISRERWRLAAIKVLYFHDAFHYFNKRYGITSVGVIVQSPGKEPTAAELVAIGKQIKQHKVKAIFTEPQLNPKAAEVIAKEYGLQVKTLDPIGSEKNVQTIAELIEYNWDIIRSAHR